MSVTENLHPAEGRPITSYSLAFSIVVDLLFAGVLLLVSIYQIVVISGFSFGWVLAGVMVGDAYFRLWRRPVRIARFYDSHFEIIGQGLRVTGRYGDIKSFDSYRQIFGDFKSGKRLWIDVEGIGPLAFPDRWNRELRIDTIGLLEKVGLPRTSEGQEGEGEV